MSSHASEITLPKLAKKNGYPPPDSHEGHTCQECGAPVACAFKEVAAARAAARADLLAAVMAERKLLGLPLGPPKKLDDLTPAQLRAMVDQFGNINRARKQLGVGWATFYRAMTGDAARR